ncbi:class I SAM-dependent methyltransferase [Aminobacter sp. BE322]|uniref:class I SAM-dependent methyltransferase n=1 Tax=unclassified Aminobacter TaxID=2644704 RepID=UPI003D1930B8
MAAGDALSFLKAWASAPRRIGAIAPSGASLATLITREIGPETGPVLELGAGTGSFTRALVARGVKERELTLVELNPEFARLLRQRFPAARVLEVDAAGLRHVPDFEGSSVGAVISGLPFLAIPPRQTYAILEGAFASLGADGAMYVFTYGFRCPIDRSVLDRLDLEVARVGHTFRNIPPAAVYRIRRMKPAKGYDWRFA